jgi:hypothetical protein
MAEDWRRKLNMMALDVREATLSHLVLTRVMAREMEQMESKSA